MFFSLVPKQCGVTAVYSLNVVLGDVSDQEVTGV